MRELSTPRNLPLHRTQPLITSLVFYHGRTGPSASLLHKVLHGHWHSATAPYSIVVKCCQSSYRTAWGSSGGILLIAAIATYPPLLWQIPIRPSEHHESFLAL